MEPTLYDLNKYTSNLKKRFPKLKIVSQRPWWLRAGFRILSKVTKLNFDNYTQAIGNTIYLPKNWENRTVLSRLITLTHESIHLHQFKRLTFPLMTIIYLLLPLPAGLALGRALLEKQAAEAGLRVRIKYLGKSERLKKSEKEKYIKKFTGPSYLWMFPFEKVVSRWFEKFYNSL